MSQQCISILWKNVCWAGQCKQTIRRKQKCTKCMYVCLYDMQVNKAYRVSLAQVDFCGRKQRAAAGR